MKRFSTFAVAVTATLLLYGASPQTAPQSKPQNNPQSKPAAAPKATASFNCLGAPTMTPTLPSDMFMPSQAEANCFAWQQFIALNWLADPNNPGQPSPSATAAQFGTANNTSPVVWESYMADTEVFLPQGATPPPWGGSSSLAVPRRFSTINSVQLSRVRSQRGGRPKLLGMTSKFDNAPPLELSSFTEAFTNSWLTAQNGNITLYEIRMNQDEYNYIVQNGLYEAKTQAAYASSTGIDLPDGTSQFSKYGSTGAIEIKAAWLELDDPSQYPLYKTSQAMVLYPGASQPVSVTVGLVGLHIIHKTKSAQQFVWATFEHVNNAPSTVDIKNKTLKSWYQYYNAQCNPDTDHYRCVANAQPTACAAGQTANCDPYDAPIQVVRMNPLDATTTNNIVGLNQQVWSMIAASNPNSVFLNYQLVNVLWPNQSQNVQQPAGVPLPQGDPQPNPANEKVANTTLETYFQQQLQCLDCHASAQAATGSTASLTRRMVIHPSRRPTDLLHGSAKPTTAATQWASDYSFLFNEAQPAPAPQQ